MAASKIPVISAVGHETDFTLCDFAADARAATPSQAAEMAVADVEGYKQRVSFLLQRCTSLMQSRLAREEHRLEAAASSWALRDPERLFAHQLQRVDMASQRLADAMLHLEEQKQHAFALAAAKLDGISPLAVLGRGYSVTQKDYAVIRSTQQVTWGDEIVTIVEDGTITSVVQQVERR